MFARVKKSGSYQYLQIVENHKEKGKVKQQVIATIGRMDKLQEETPRRNTHPFALQIFRTSLIHSLGQKRGVGRCRKKLDLLLYLNVYGSKQVSRLHCRPC